MSAIPSFANEGQGTLELVVETQPMGNEVVAESVDWELWLNTRHFASGVNLVGEKLPATQPKTLTISVPLVFRGLQSTPEPALLTVSVRGGLRVKSGGTESRHPFERVAKRSVANAPVLESGTTDE